MTQREEFISEFKRFSGLDVLFDEYGSAYVSKDINNAICNAVASSAWWGWQAAKATIASNEGDELDCDDISRLRQALSWIGYSTPVSLEECGARHVSLTRDLIRAVLKHKEAKTDFLAKRCQQCLMAGSWFR